MEFCTNNALFESLDVETRQNICKTLSNSKQYAVSSAGCRVVLKNADELGLSVKIINDLFHCAYATETKIRERIEELGESFIAKRMGGQLKFDEDFENQVVHFINSKVKGDMLPSRKEVLDFVYKRSRTKVSTGWLSTFLKRHPEACVFTRSIRRESDPTSTKRRRFSSQSANFTLRDHLTFLSNIRTKIEGIPSWRIATFEEVAIRHEEKVEVLTTVAHQFCMEKEVDPFVHSKIQLCFWMDSKMAKPAVYYTAENDVPENFPHHAFSLLQRQERLKFNADVFFFFL
jgi:hypothetical protein